MCILWSNERFGFKLEVSHLFVKLTLYYCLKHFQIWKKIINFAQDKPCQTIRDVVNPLSSLIIVLKKW